VTSEITVKEHQITLPNGISAQVLSATPHEASDKKPPLVFLHGGLHAAWCWNERFFPFFVSLGYPVVAFSWRGTSGTFAGEGVKKVKVAEHVHDLQGFLEKLPSILGDEKDYPKPIILSHSLGGIIVMKYLESCCNKTKPSKSFSGIVMMCSMPPSGQGKMSKRTLWRSVFDVWKIVRGIPMKKALTDANLCRELFFGGKSKLRGDGTLDDFGVSDDDVARYQELFVRDSQVSMDMADLARNLPSNKVDGKGQAPFVADLPRVLVIGAKYDFLVDYEATVETAKYFGKEEPVIVDSAHDVMLGQGWKVCAETIHNWVKNMDSRKVGYLTFK
jgi:pimeloyl-ACP methyl ester carboxylesterase